MNFKDQLKKDLGVFINPEEFGDVIIIDNQTISVVFDDDQLQKYNLKAEGEGLTKGELLFYAPSSAFIEKPFAEKRLKIKNRLYKILNVSEDLGVYTITLVGYRS